MNILMRSGIAAAVLAVFQLGVMHYGKSLPPADIGPTKAKIEAVPLQIGPYEATEATLDEKIFVATQADYMRTLSLVSPEGRRASLSLGIWTNFHLGLPHEPIYCYPANGWTLRERRRTEIKAPGCEPIEAWIVSFDRPIEGTNGREVQPAVVIYWGQLAGQVVLDRSDIRAVKQRFRRTDIEEMPPLVKVHLHVEAATLEDATVQAEDLAVVVRGLTKDL